MQLNNWEDLGTQAKEELMTDAPEEMQWLGWVVYDEQSEKFLSAMDVTEDAVASIWKVAPEESMVMSMTEAATVVGSGLLCTDHTFLVLAKVTMGLFTTLLHNDQLNAIVRKVIVPSVELEKARRKGLH